MVIFNMAVCVLILLLLISKFKLNSFLSLLAVSLFLGILNGMPLSVIPASIYSGFGDQLKSLTLIIIFGAVIGKLLNDSGAANQIAYTLLRVFGEKNVQAAILVTALLIGITMFFEAAFVVLIPIIYTLALKLKISLLYIGLPGVIGLSITHSFLPPHPGPAAVCSLYGADMGLTFIIGLSIVLPIAFIIGILYSRSGLVCSVKPELPKELVPQKISDENLPSFPLSVFCALLPVIFIGLPAMLELTNNVSAVNSQGVKFLSSPVTAMMLGAFMSVYFLGMRRGKTVEDLNSAVSQAVKSVSIIIMVIGAGGAFKQVILDSNTGDSIAAVIEGWNFSPIITVWASAAILRTFVGSATVAVNMAAGMMSPIVQSCGISPEIMVLATSTGSIFASHINDPGFWMFKEYFNLSLADAIKIRTTYTCILSLAGLAGILLVNALLS